MPRLWVSDEEGGKALGGLILMGSLEVYLVQKEMG